VLDHVRVGRRPCEKELLDLRKRRHARCGADGITENRLACFRVSMWRAYFLRLPGNYLKPSWAQYLDIYSGICGKRAKVATSRVECACQHARACADMEGPPTGSVHSGQVGAPPPTASAAVAVRIDDAHHFGSRAKQELHSLLSRCPVDATAAVMPPHVHYPPLAPCPPGTIPGGADSGHPARARIRDRQSALGEGCNESAPPSYRRLYQDARPWRALWDD
jgi:hypothetical protein